MGKKSRGKRKQASLKRSRRKGGEGRRQVDMRAANAAVDWEYYDQWFSRMFTFGRTMMYFGICLGVVPLFLYDMGAHPDPEGASSVFPGRAGLSGPGVLERYRSAYSAGMLMWALRLITTVPMGSAYEKRSRSGLSIAIKWMKVRLLLTALMATALAYPFLRVTSAWTIIEGAGTAAWNVLLGALGSALCVYTLYWARVKEPVRSAHSDT
jgi:hypothetical protein